MAKLLWNQSGVHIQGLTSLIVETQDNTSHLDDSQKMFVIRKTKLNLENCYFGFEGTKDPNDMRNKNKKES